MFFVLPVFKYICIINVTFCILSRYCWISNKNNSGFKLWFLYLIPKEIDNKKKSYILEKNRGNDLKTYFQSDAKKFWVKENIIKKGTILYKPITPAVILPYNSRHTMRYSSGVCLNLTLSKMIEWHGDSWLLFHLD